MSGEYLRYQGMVHALMRACASEADKVAAACGIDGGWAGLLDSIPENRNKVRTRIKAAIVAANSTSELQLALSPVEMCVLLHDYDRTNLMNDLDMPPATLTTLLQNCERYAAGMWADKLKRVTP